ncbi:leucine-rich repeat domain-containing protein [Formosa sp. 3Alg 14/1]|uniref:leucine-rich repeat domain-containing protein n=1 Tax=Formosa sp. 3Alg 14/1 TaxID=3382190 RepID=UPI0039BE60C4
MKTKLIFLLLVFIYLHTHVQCITNVNIPDANFKNSLLTDHTIDTNSDGEISCDEAASFTGDMNVSNKSITDLTGIEAFTSLTKLTCFNISITSLDISQNTALTYLNCFNNSLTSLDISNNTALYYLSFSNNNVTSLDVSQHPLLETLSFSSNSITSLDLSNNTALTSLTCHTNQLTSLDVSNNTALESLSCSNMSLNSLDISKNTALKKLTANTIGLTSLDVSQNPALYYIACYSNGLTSLDISQNPALTTLNCNTNQITSLDISQNPLVYSLNCSSNSLTSLNIANGNNENLGLNATNNPDLTCIQIDEGHTYFGDWDKDETADYSTIDCNALSIADENFHSTIKVYPNPIINTLFINLEGKQEFKKAQIFNISGKVLLTTSNTTIDMSSFSAGIYLLKIENTENKVAVRKVIKK